MVCAMRVWPDLGGGKTMRTPSMISWCIPSSGSCSNASQLIRLVAVGLVVVAIRLQNNANPARFGRGLRHILTGGRFLPRDKVEFCGPPRKPDENLPFAGCGGCACSDSFG